MCQTDAAVVEQEAAPKDNTSSVEASNMYERGVGVVMYFLSSLFYIVIGATIASVAGYAHLYNNIALGWFRGFSAPVVIFLTPLIGDGGMGIYDSMKNGSWYDFGFVIGLLTLGWGMVWTKNRLLED